MNIAEYSIKKKTISLVMTILILVWGILAYENLGRLEDPEFTIKKALVITQYPGASPLEVEQEVTDILETAIQQMAQLDKVTSMSKKGISYIYVDIKASFKKKDLPQIWDELRRKVSDARGKLPPGAKTPIVKDDFGDVYGVFFAITGDGYSYSELKDYADFLKRELLLVKDVAKVDTWGEMIESVYVEISRSKALQLGIPLPKIFQMLSENSTVTDAGSVRVGSEYIRISPTGGFSSVEDIGDFLIAGAPTDNPVYLKDIAEIRKDYYEPAQSIMRYNGKPAIGIGISTVSDGNVVTMGEAVKSRLRQLRSKTPVGMELGIIAYQSDTVSEAVNGFVTNLVEAVAIVIGLLLVFMGLQSGILIGSILILTIAGTLIVMQLFGINLQKISLGALILALGMLVDNAIVVTEGILINIQKGMDRFKAAGQIVKETMWPLLGATVVAILAFAAIGASNDNTGEYCRSLFQVVLISLMISWILAITLTPLFCTMFLKAGNKTDTKDPYAGPIYQRYKKLLALCINHKVLTLASMVVLLVISIVGFGFVEQNFFPNSTRPQFIIDYWKIQGSHIEDTSEDMKEIEKYVLKQEGVTAVTSFIGKGALRFILTYDIKMPEPSFGQMVVSVRDAEKIDGLINSIGKYLRINHPNAEPRLSRFASGPSSPAQIEARFSGPDPRVLKNLAASATEIMSRDKDARCIKTDWRQRVKVIKPVYAEANAKALGITLKNLNQTLRMNFTGSIAGVYREKNKLLPIIVRPPLSERGSVDNMNDIQLLSPVTGKMVPFGQIVTRVDTGWEDPVIRRRNRIRTVTAQCDIASGNSSVLFNRLKPQIEKIPLPEGYSIKWGGVHENSSKAQKGLAKLLPACFLGMVLTIIMLFNSIRQPLIIFLCLPLAVIGVTAGLLLTGQPFGFMALLGFLSLSGMLIKNAIVLIDQIDLKIREGEAFYTAVLDSSVSRVRPVLMAAMTTVLGMMPLLFDNMFVSMAVTIMFGLSFGTLLTLFVVPVLYITLIKEKDPKAPKDQDGEELESPMYMDHSQAAN